MNRSLGLDSDVWVPNVVEPARFTDVTGGYFLISSQQNAKPRLSLILRDQVNCAISTSLFVVNTCSYACDKFDNPLSSPRSIGSISTHNSLVETCPKRPHLIKQYPAAHTSSKPTRYHQ